MKSRMHWLLVTGLSVVLLLLWSGQTQASRQLSSPRFAPGSGISMKVTNFFEDLPPRGYLPLRVEVKNGSNAAREWDFQALQSMGDSRTMTFVTKLAVPANSQRMFDLLIPLIQQPMNAARYSNLNLVVSGYGVASGSTSEYSSGVSGRPTPYLGMGRALALKYWTPLKDYYSKEKSRVLAGSQLEPPLLPNDWKGWACFDAVVFSAQEWRSLEAATRQALLNWVAQGGRLALFHLPGSPPPDLPESGPVGAGEIQLVATEGEATTEKISGFLDTAEESSQAKLSGEYTWNWAAADSVGRSTPPKTFIIIFVLCFAAIIGPVNFLVFAPSGHRHRLFWTTPLISIVASLLMGAGIVLSEGLGGEGLRVGLLWIQPAERRAVVWQEQVSRTGVLLSSRFSTSQPCFLSPLTLRQPSSNPVLFGGRAAFGYLTEGKGVWSGDWFRSRSTQAQALVAISSTRERIEIEVSGDAAPTATSSFASSLQGFWYLGPDGKFWSAPAIQPGEKVTLEPATEAEFNVWRDKQLALAGPLVKARALALMQSASSNTFFSEFPKFGGISTLDSIKWTASSGILIGPTQL